jgi:hypothetical protein
MSQILIKKEMGIEKKADRYIINFLFCDSPYREFRLGAKNGEILLLNN